MEFTIAYAKRLVETKIKEFDSEEFHCVVVDDATIEKNDYWVFFYNSSRFIETGDFSDSLMGNAPYIVDKYEGGIYSTGAVYDTEYYMDQFEKIDLPQIKSRIATS
ncbi:YrhB domain-containing protein [Paraflavitalea pollutisoli]|uniref:YrhB domain-containing protein n=1 Tax=Paraflavitalea pollutisoli TaxID=3034143 RepID=UPI0023EDB5CC|nr:YrhB domain-containing protein [Paraflavitalea sp. H1-2-19X]